MSLFSLFLVSMRFGSSWSEVSSLAYLLASPFDQQAWDAECDEMVEQGNCLEEKIE